MPDHRTPPRRKVRPWADSFSKGGDPKCSRPRDRRMERHMRRCPERRPDRGKSLLKVPVHHGGPVSEAASLLRALVGSTDALRRYLRDPIPSRTLVTLDSGTVTRRRGWRGALEAGATHRSRHVGELVTSPVDRAWLSADLKTTGSAAPSGLPRSGALLVLLAAQPGGARGR
jgi:hypothetical protein